MKKSQIWQSVPGFLAGSGVDDTGKNGSAVYLKSSLDETLRAMLKVYAITAIETDIPAWAQDRYRRN